MRSRPIPKPGSHSVYVSATDNTNGTIYQFNINTDGTLSPFSPAQVASGIQPVHFAIDPAGQFLYAADHASGGSIDQYRINADGTLTTLGVGPGGAAFSLTFAPNGKFVYGGAQLGEYKVNADGTLTNIGALPVNSVVQDVAIDPTSKFLYATDPGVKSISDGLLRAYKLNPDGTLTPNGDSLKFGLSPYALTMHPNRQFLYVTSIFGPDNVVGQFHINVDGTITPLSPPTLTVGKQPIAMSISPDGRFVYITNQLDNTVSQLRVNADGTLTPLNPATIPG